MTMRETTIGAAVLGIGLALPALGQPMVFSDFDEDDEGWTIINSGEIEHKLSGGNPGGFLEVTDVPEPPGSYEVVAPEKFHGDQFAMYGGKVWWDARVLEGDIFDWVGSYGRITLVGAGMEATYDPVPPGVVGNGWTRYEGVLSASNFGLTEEDFQALLSDVTEVRLRLEAVDGEDVMGFDNFTFSRCEADVNEDFKLDILDFVAFQILWLKQDPDADTNSDGEFDILDFVIFQTIFQDGCGF